jgi:hypothetical protein
MDGDFAGPYQRAVALTGYGGRSTRPAPGSTRRPSASALWASRARAAED